MPPKRTPSNPSITAEGPTWQQIHAITAYLAQKPDFDKLIAEAKSSPPPPSSRVESDYDRTLREAVKEVFIERSKEARSSKSKEIIMPVGRKEEETHGNLTDQVAKESSDSAASDHPMHQEGGKATISDHKATPGPVMSENLPKASSKEELRKRAEELNKKD